MTNDTQLTIAVEEFSASVEPTDGGLSLRLAGNGDIKIVPELQALIPRVHEEARRVGAACVVVDLTEVEFMNSSCFRAFVSWLNVIRGLEADQQYRVRFVANPGRHWQRPSLQALYLFARGLVEVENIELST